MLIREPLAVAKAGRKRKNVLRREKNGRVQRPSRAEQRDRVMSVALAQRRKAGLEGDAARDQRAESPTGRLLLRGLLTHAEWQAGERLRSRRTAFLVELGRKVDLREHCAGGSDLGPATPGPRMSGSIAAVAVAREVRAEDAENRSDRPETPHERRKRVLEQWGEAKAAAAEACGGSRLGLRLLLEVTCELVEPRDRDEATIVKAGLRRLATRWGFDEPGEKGEPDLRGLRLALDGREAWRFPKAKNTGTGGGGA